MKQIIKRLGLCIYLSSYLMISTSCSSLGLAFVGFLVHSFAIMAEVMGDANNPLLHLTDACCGYYLDRHMWPTHLDELEEYCDSTRSAFDPTKFETLSYSGRTDSSLSIQFKVWPFETDSSSIVWFEGHLDVIRPQTDSCNTCNARIIFIRGKIEHPEREYVIKADTIRINSGVIEFQGGISFVPH